jgi:hypothetical protein
VLTLVVSSLPSTIFAAQAKIQGDYCYQYGDSESLMAAKEISYAMALRKAIETYKTFVASTSVVQDFKLRKDLVETIASGYVENVRIVRQDVKGRNVCTELVGYVNPDAVKSIIARKVEKVQKNKRKKVEGLIIGYDHTILNHYKKGSKLCITYRANKSINYIGASDEHKLIIDCFDKNGQQTEGNYIYLNVHLVEGEVRRECRDLPIDAVSYELRFGY